MKDYKRLYKAALISSPFMGIYGITPVYVFLHASLRSFFLGCLFLTLVVLSFWIANIIILKFQEIGLLRNLISYGVIFTMMIFFHYLFEYHIRDIVGEQLPRENFIFPFLNSFAMNTIIIIISNAIILRERKRTSDNKVIHLEIKNKEAQQELLMQQFQPHFLFNALSTLKSLIRRNADEAENYILKLSDFLRFSIQAHKENTVTLERELNFTTQYIEMQQIRFEDSIICKIEVSGEVLNKKIPVFALQSLVENAFKHNTFAVENPLQISICNETDELGNDKISVSNNKSIKKNIESSGIGLASLNLRYELITGKSIEINDTEEQFCIKLFLIE
jgi:sensor histidine kinase YesM